MHSIIKWFVLLLYKDMQNFKMDKETDLFVQKQIKDKLDMDEKISSDSK